MLSLINDNECIASPLIRPRRRVPPFLPHDGGEAASVLGATILLLSEIRFFTPPFGEWKARSTTLKAQAPYQVHYPLILHFQLQKLSAILIIIKVKHDQL